LKRLIAVAVVLAGTAAPAFAEEHLSIASVTPTDGGSFVHHEAPAQTVTGDLYLPKVPGPVPALILKHGSGGLSGATGDNIRKWARMINDWGVAAFVVDSFKPRGITETATNQGQLTIWADIADSLAALRLLGGDPRIDKSRIGIMGWSRGGGVAAMTALEKVRKAGVESDLKFALHIAFYAPGSVQFREFATDKSPMLWLHGESDNYVPIAPAREYAAWFQSLGNPVTFIGFPGAYHDFDVEESAVRFAKTVQIGAKCDLVVSLDDGRVLRMDHKNGASEDTRAYMRSCIGHGANLGYNASARAAAVRKVHAFLKKNFHIPG
jgi:dienelactone hydrolase